MPHSRHTLNPFTINSYDTFCHPNTLLFALKNPVQEMPAFNPVDYKVLGGGTEASIPKVPCTPSQAPRGPQILSD